jgi:CheY-like chemotaxis protein
VYFQGEGDQRQPVRFIGVNMDISDRKMSDEALRQADRQKDEFLAMLSHELRNPLAPIRNAVEIMRLLGSKESALVEAQDIVERQLTHLVRLVDDLLDVSRITRGKVHLKMEPIEIARVIAAAVEGSRPLLVSRGHDFEVRLPAEPLRVQGDMTRLAQVVGNLLNNAAKYTEDGGQVRLIVQREGVEVAVRVQDTGVGIDPEVLPGLFELFTQADQTIDRAQGGLGIGLALVRRLVEMHGGRVQAFSQGLGQGSEFVLFLPLLSRAPASDPSEPPDKILPGRARLQILVVDDNVDAAETMAILLRLLGHEVNAVHDGYAALEAVALSVPQVVLLDIGLPGLDGYEVCRRLRQGFLKQGVIVAMTGYGQDDDRKRSQKAGFDAHLVKPVDPTELQSLLMSLISPARNKIT